MSEEKPEHLFQVVNNRFRREGFNRGRKRLFTDPVDLWERCCEYFEWMVENPFPVEQYSFYEGEMAHGNVNKPRPFTIQGMAAFIGFGKDEWAEWRNNREDLKEVIREVDHIIYTQKFEGASAGVMNPNLITRDLGLADRNEVSGPNGGAIKTEDTTADRLKDYLNGLAERRREAGEPSGD